MDESSRSWAPNSVLVNEVADRSPEWRHGRVLVRSATRIGASYGLSGGQVYRVHADLERGGSLSFVLKREAAQAVERALRFHRAVGPHAADSVSKCLGGLVDPLCDAGILLLDDIAPAEQGDVLAGCSDAQARAAVRSLARIHAVSRVATGEEHPDGGPRWQASVATAGLWDDRLSAAAARFPRILTPSLVDQLHGLPPLVEAALDSLHRSDACWIHGDAHLDNVLFRPDGTAVFLDWSGAVIGPAAVDLARLLTEGVNAGAQSELATELISGYANELDARGAKMLIGDPWQALSDGLAPLAQAAIAWAARDEIREPRARMRSLQENLLRSVGAWVSNAHLTKPGRVFA